MAVLLLILKIIGIILLILLGLILLILAVVLFVPVRYQVSGSIGEKTTVRIAVTWLLHAVSWVFFTAADLWDHSERKKAGRWRTRGG